MTRRIVILGAGPQQIPAIAKAHELGYEVICPDMNPQAAGLAMCEYPLPGVSTNHGAAVLDALLDLEKRGVKAHGIAAVAVEAAETVAFVGQRLGLPSNSEAVANACSDKLTRINTLKKAGVPVPDFGSAQTVDEAVAVARRIGFPVVFKPLHLAGAKGVVKVDDEDQVRSRFEICFPKTKGTVLIEKYLTGSEHSSESMVLDGAVYTTGFSDRNYETKFLYPPHFLENGDACPSALSDDVKRGVIAAVESAIHALGIEMGPAKGDILVTKDGQPYIIEMAGRMSGDYFCSLTAPLNNGCDLLGAVLQQAVGDPVSPDKLKPRYDRGVALRYVWPAPGRITAIRGIEECRTHPDVRFIRFEPYWAQQNIDVGTQITAPTCHGERVAAVMAVGETRDEAVALAERIVSRIQIETVADQVKPTELSNKDEV